MKSNSLLFEKPERIARESKEEPGFLHDLNLDQIIEALTDGREEYNLRTYYYTPLKDSDAICYRQEIFRDLENEPLFENLKIFSEKMREVRRYTTMIASLYYHYHKNGWFLESVAAYCGSVLDLLRDLSSADLKSRGLSNFRNYLSGYAASEPFTRLLEATKSLKNELAAVKYAFIIKGLTVKVRHYEWEADYSSEVEAIFEKFKQGAVKDYRINFRDKGGLNSVEAGILEGVARLFPDLFSKLTKYCDDHRDYLDPSIVTFDREIQFFLAYKDLMAKFKRQELKFCYPRVSEESKDIFSHEGFDLALAEILLRTEIAVVSNDFYLKDQERIIIVTGPNQGGKTTFARTFGQLHYLAALGCPVPGREARLFLFDSLFTHFERQETIKNLRGKLQDDLIRIHDILTRATTNSLIIMNEIFSSTTLNDAVVLSHRIMKEITALDALCVWVTFIDELASFGKQTVSMVSTVVAENPTLRTFKIVRKPADGLSYALSVAEKYRLTYHHLKERLNS
jgi:DNA mismatch repair protein MutS